MYTKSTGIVQYNATKDRVEILRPVHATERTNPNSYYQLEEFLTGTVIKMVQAKDLNAHRQHDVLHVWGKELYTMEMYVTLLRDLHRMVIYHGPNTEIFGPQADQGFVMKSVGNKIHVGMQVVNRSVLVALNARVAGIMEDGTILRDGTTTTFDSFVEMASRRVDSGMSIIPKTIRSALLRQWHEATDKEIEGTRQLYSQGLPGDWKDYYDLQKTMDALNISHTTINRYRAGQVPAGYGPFPNPDRFRGRSPYWHKTTIDTWTRSRLQD